MMKKVCYFLMAFLCLFAFYGIVGADEQTDEKVVKFDDLQNVKCGSSVKSKDLQAASNVKVAYEPLEYDPEDGTNRLFYYVDITVYNIPDEVYVEV